jgi:TRAP transporter 4TM/12TM fusion protein
VQGNYMMQLSFALLGHLRGGPAKVSVVSSGLNGLISGSSVSNVVSGGIFTIPLMKKAGYGGVKAGAIETMSSVDGQLMPPVMGAAAFLMVEYVGIPYPEICKHAFLPAILSYIALFYIVHLEALKLDMKPLVRRTARTAREKLYGWALGISGTIAVCCIIYFVAEGTKRAFGDAAPWVLGLLLAVTYVWSVRVAARCPDLPSDIDVDNPIQPKTWPTVKAGLHFLIPLGVLVWCLMIEELSPALAAFWATAALIVLMATQRMLTSFFRGQRHAGRATRARVARHRRRIERRGAQHDRHRDRDRHRRDHRRRHHADRPGLADDRVRRVRVVRQRGRDAALHRVPLSRAGAGRADDRELHPRSRR